MNAFQESFFTAQLYDIFQSFNLFSLCLVERLVKIVQIMKMIIDNVDI